MGLFSAVVCCGNHGGVVVSYIGLALLVAETVVVVH